MICINGEDCIKCRFFSQYSGCKFRDNLHMLLYQKLSEVERSIIIRDLEKAFSVDE